MMSCLGTGHSSIGFSVYRPTGSVKDTHIWALVHFYGLIVSISVFKWLKKVFEKICLCPMFRVIGLLCKIVYESWSNGQLL